MDGFFHTIVDHPAFAPVRFKGDAALKAGILPFYRDQAGLLHFLVAAPKAVRNADDTLPLAIARGSRRVKTADGGWMDVRSAQALERAIHEGREIEPAHQTALAEGREELGLPIAAVGALYDGGILAYKDYGIHCFAAEIAPQTALHPAQDSAAVRWVTLAQATDMVEIKAFSAGYLPLLAAWACALKG